MFEIINKYAKYSLEYRRVSNVLKIYKPIPVKEFMELKRDIKNAGIELNNIIVEGR